MRYRMKLILTSTLTVFGMPRAGNFERNFDRYYFPNLEKLIQASASILYLCFYLVLSIFSCS